MRLQLVAYYNGTTRDIIWSQTEKIQWLGGAPPLDNPPCVFSKDDPTCIDGTTSSFFFSNKPFHCDYNFFFFINVKSYPKHMKQ